MDAVEFTRGPFVQNATTNSIQVIWETSQSAESLLEYGLTPGLGAVIHQGRYDTNHVLTLTDLEPGTRYFYSVISRATNEIVISPIESFATLKTGGPIRFAIISDTAQNSSYLPQPKLVSVLAQMQADLVMHLGDIVVSDFNYLNVQGQFFNVFQPLIKNTSCYLLLGNHDLVPAAGEAIDLGAPGFHSAFHLPTNSMDGTSRYYSFDHGDVHFVCLFNPWFYFYEFNAQTDQYRWLTNDLAQSDKPWKLLFCHAPVMTSSLHALDDYNWNGIPDQVEMLNLIAPLAHEYGVQMVFNGHDHSLHRYAPDQGLHFCVTAGGGQGLYALATPHRCLSKYWQLHHCLGVGITNDTMTLEAYDVTGTRFDTWTVQKGLPPRALHLASWHRPVMASSAEDDEDGNVNGQIFDFIGTPLYPRSGQFSNLGRVYVNNDSNYLYLGLEQVMIRNDHNIFLFIESPRGVGVSTMAGLGNGRLDPEGEGVDGLDCLENLAFGNFSPCVGCLLGDEYADRTFRSFTRTNLGLNIGQGIFHLDQTFSDVTGAHLQQFNLSPQTNFFPTSPANVASEQNADYMQLAIPLHELGGLQPGDRIRLGVLVGGPDYDALAQTRWLDSSVLGVRLDGHGMQSSLLEGVEVQLALPPFLDSDNDGFYDWQENLAGTDANDGQSALRLEAVPQVGGQVLLSWSSVPGKRYVLETSDSVPIGFRPVNEGVFPLTAGSTNETYLVEGIHVGCSASRFYRVRLVVE